MEGLKRQMLLELLSLKFTNMTKQNYSIKCPDGISAMMETAIICASTSLVRTLPRTVRHLSIRNQVQYVTCPYVTIYSGYQI